MKKIDFDVIEKIGEGKRGEVYKIKLKNGKFAALKYSKNYNNDKEWEILTFLNGIYAPKPIFKSKKYFIMELIEGKPLKCLLNTPEYYESLKLSLKGAFLLDEKGVFHKQLGRYYHILFDSKKVTFIDFERSVITENPRNFLQIIGYYLFRDENFDKKSLNLILDLYKKDKLKALKESIKVIDEIKNKAFYRK